MRWVNFNIFDSITMRFEAPGRARGSSPCRGARPPDAHTAPSTNRTPAGNPYQSYYPNWGMLAIVKHGVGIFLLITNWYRYHSSIFDIWHGYQSSIFDIDFCRSSRGRAEDPSKFVTKCTTERFWYRGSSLTRNTPPVGRDSSPMLRDLWWS